MHAHITNPIPPQKTTTTKQKTKNTIQKEKRQKKTSTHNIFFCAKLFTVVCKTAWQRLSRILTVTQQTVAGKKMGPNIGVPPLHVH